MNDSRRLVVITGAAGGIGSVTALTLARSGWDTTLVDRNHDRLESVAEMIRESTGREAYVVPCDVSDPGFASHVEAAVANKNLLLRGLVNCAGVIGNTAIEETTDEEWNRIFDVNINAPFRLTRALVPHLRAANGAAVVNVSSSVAVAAAPSMPAYCASKAAVLGLTRALAVDLEKDGIRVNAICPASIDTDMPKSRIAHLTAAELAKYEKRHFVRQIINRYGTPQEVADVIDFLLSEKASFLTGLSLPVDGGYTAW